MYFLGFLFQLFKNMVPNKIDDRGCFCFSTCKFSSAFAFKELLPDDGAKSSSILKKELC